jgi:hypothetical protein
MDLIYEPPMIPIYTVVIGPSREDAEHPHWPWMRIRQLSGSVPRGQARDVELDVALGVMTLWKTREELVAEKMMQ